MSLAWYCSCNLKTINTHTLVSRCARVSVNFSQYDMDILETNCLTQLSQSARREALPTDYEDDVSDMADEDTLEGQSEQLPL